MIPHKRPVPTDFCEVAQGKSVNKLALHYRAKSRTIDRWLHECGIDRGSLPTSNKRAVPADFADRAAEMHRMALCDHYNADDGIVRRWIKESGIEPIRWVPPVSQRTARQMRLSGGKRASLSLVVTTKAVRTWGEADDAANKLRKFGPVSRCDEDGKFNICGKFWRVGRVVLSDAEIIERANRRRAA